jgi:hypothetical protein
MKRKTLWSVIFTVAVSIQCTNVVDSNMMGIQRDFFPIEKIAECEFTYTQSADYNGIAADSVSGLIKWSTNIETFSPDTVVNIIVKYSPPPLRDTICPDSVFYDSLRCILKGKEIVVIDPHQIFKCHLTSDTLRLLHDPSHLIKPFDHTVRGTIVVGYSDTTGFFNNSAYKGIIAGEYVNYYEIAPYQINRYSQMVLAENIGVASITIDRDVYHVHYSEAWSLISIKYR